MKNIKVITLILTILFMGCVELEEEPTGILAPEGFFKDKGDVEAAIFGAYGRMASGSSWGGGIVTLLQFRGDLVNIGFPGASAAVKGLNDFNTDATNPSVLSVWSVCYSIMGATNNAILGAQVISASEEEKNALEAEARVIRAYIYYTLVRLFGDIPYFDGPITDPSSIGSVSRLPEAEVYSKIIEDLEFGKQHLPFSFPSGSRRRATSGTAATILASVHLTLENWEDSYNEAKWVIDHKGDLDYDLVSDYQDLFDATKQDGISEHIFAVDFLGLQRGVDNDDTTPVFSAGPATNGWSSQIPSMEVYDQWDERDYRKEVSMIDEYVNGSGVTVPYTEWLRPRPHMQKFSKLVGNSQNSGRQSDNNYALFRYAEVLLIAAEALNEQSGPTSEAKGYVNEVRSRARIWPDHVDTFPADVSATLSDKGEFRSLILEERKWELAFEFKRWFDIKRRKMADEAFKTSGSLETHLNFDANKHYLFAVPQTEIDKNPNLLPQNPGFE